MNVCERISEDFRIFLAKQPGGITKLIFFPGIRIVFHFRLSQCCYQYLLKPLAYFITNLNDILHGIWIAPRAVADRAGLDVVSLSSFLKNLSVLGAGTILPNPQVLLNRASPSYFINQANNQYDIVIKETKLDQFRYGSKDQVPDDLLFRDPSITLSVETGYATQQAFIQALIATLLEKDRLKLGGLQALNGKH